MLKLQTVFIICALLLATTDVVVRAINSRGCWEYEPMPDNLNDKGYLDFKSEAHLHSKYYVNASASYKTIAFSLSEASYYR